MSINEPVTEKENKEEGIFCEGHRIAVDAKQRCCLFAGLMLAVAVVAIVFVIVLNLSCSNLSFL